MGRMKEYYQDQIEAMQNAPSADDEENYHDHKKEVIGCWIYLEEHHFDALQFIKDPSEKSITIMTTDYLGEERDVKVTVEALVEYYVSQANNITSGLRTLAGHVGDWRPINGMAEFCLEYFRGVNIKSLREVSEKRGLTPKF